MMILQQTRGALSSGGFDRLAARYIRAVETAGATVTTAQRNAINLFFKDGRTNGWISSMRRIYLPIWGAAAPNAIDMMSVSSGTFSGTVTHASGYVQGDGSTGFFNYGTPPSTLGITTSSGFVFNLINQSPSITGSRSFGAVSNDPSNTTYFGMTTISGGTLLSGVFGSLASTSGYVESALNHNATNGIISASRISGVSTLQRRRTSGNSILASQTDTSTGNIPSIHNMYAIGTNQAGNLTSPTNARFGSYGIGVGISTTEATDFTSSLKTLWETCTGLTLP